MAGILTDQAFVDRLVNRVRGRFEYYDCWRMWFQRKGEWLDSGGAEVALRGEYLDMLADVEDEEQARKEWHSRARATMAASQNWALWLLRQDARLQGDPNSEQWRMKRNQENTLSACAKRLSDCAYSLSVPEESLERFFNACLQGDKNSGPNVVIRLDGEEPELDLLYPLAVELFGDRAVRVPGRYWQYFPGSLTPALALHLMGASLVFLEGLENPTMRRHFPQWALYRWLSWETAEWCGKDDRIYTLRLPTHFILCGPPLQFRYLEREVRGHILPVARPEDWRDA